MNASRHWTALLLFALLAAPVTDVCAQDSAVNSVQFSPDGTQLVTAASDRTHWAYYERVLDGAEHRPEPRMPIVCEQFEVVFTREDAAMIETENDIH